MAAMGGVERAVTQSMIPAGEGENPGPAGGEQGGFEGGFDGFKAGIGKDGFAGQARILRAVAAVQRSKVRRLSSRASAALRGVGINVAHGVEEKAHLPPSRRDDARVGVARRGHAERRSQVEIFPAGRVPDMDAAGALPDHRRGKVRRDGQDVGRFVVAQEAEDFLGAVHVRRPAGPGAR